MYDIVQGHFVNNQYAQKKEYTLNGDDFLWDL